MVEVRPRLRAANVLVECPDMAGPVNITCHGEEIVMDQARLILPGINMVKDTMSGLRRAGTSVSFRVETCGELGGNKCEVLDEVETVLLPRSGRTRHGLEAGTRYQLVRRWMRCGRPGPCATAALLRLEGGGGGLVLLQEQRCRR